MSLAASARSGAWSARYLLFTALAGLALLAYATLRFPASLAAGGLPEAVVSGTGLLVYAVVAFWGAHSPSHRVQAALWRGAVFGFVLGAAAIIGHTLEVFSALPSPLPAILGVGTWGLMFLLLGLASAETMRRAQSIALSIAASVWAAVISASSIVVFALIVGLVFMPRMQQVLGAQTLAGATTPAVVVRNMLDGASTHLLIAPVVAVLAGATSAAGCLILKSIRRPTAVALGIGCFVVLMGGITALRVASSLERSARPPFVMLGLASLGVALTSAGPVFAAIRSPKRS